MGLSDTQTFTDYQSKIQPYLDSEYEKYVAELGSGGNPIDKDTFDKVMTASRYTNPDRYYAAIGPDAKKIAEQIDADGRKEAALAKRPYIKEKSPGILNAAIGGLTDLVGLGDAPKSNYEFRDPKTGELVYTELGKKDESGNTVYIDNTEYKGDIKSPTKKKAEEAADIGNPEDRLPEDGKAALERLRSLEYTTYEDKATDKALLNKFLKQANIHGAEVARNITSPTLAAEVMSLGQQMVSHETSSGTSGSLARRLDEGGKASRDIVARGMTEAVDERGRNTNRAMSAVAGAVGRNIGVVQDETAELGRMMKWEKAKDDIIGSYLDLASGATGSELRGIISDAQRDLAFNMQMENLPDVPNVGLNLGLGGAKALTDSLASYVTRANKAGEKTKGPSMIHGYSSAEPAEDPNDMIYGYVTRNK